MAQPNRTPEEAAEKRRAYMREYRDRNRERINEAGRENYNRNRQKIREYQKRYHSEHAAELKEKAKAHRLANLEEVRSRDRARYPQKKQYNLKWLADHPGYKNAAQRKYKKKHLQEIKERELQDRSANPEKYKNYDRKTYAKHREKRLAVNRRYRDNNRDKIREMKRRYSKEHPESEIVRSQNRRARHAAAAGRHTQKDILELLERQASKCGTCKKRFCKKNGKLQYHVDHVMPLARGGSNDPSNLQLLCPPCNRKKQALHPDEWAKRNGKLFC